MKNKRKDFNLVIIPLFLGDIALFFITQSTVFWLRLQTKFFSPILSESYFLGSGIKYFFLYLNHILIGTLFFILICIWNGIYARKLYVNRRFILADMSKVILIWISGFLLISFFFKVEPSISRSFVILTGIFSLAVLFLWRVFLNYCTSRGWMFRNTHENILVVGWNRETEHLWRRFDSESFSRMSIQGAIVPHDGRFEISPPNKMPIVGSINDINSQLSSGCYDILLISDTNMPAEQLSQIIQICHRELVQFMLIPAFFEVLISGLHIESIQGVPVISIGRLPLDGCFSRLSKRFIDILGSITGLLFSAPIIIFFIILVKIESPGPGLYMQRRVGRGGSAFKIVKIRSMRIGSDINGDQWAVEGDERRLRIGAFMRKWNIDELPQFWNVLKGDMSLVGPRPEMKDLTNKFKHQIDYYNLRHSVRPGLTGWAAVNGWRGDTDLNERIRYDLDYIERWSLLFDFYIMLLTFLKNKNAY